MRIAFDARFVEQENTGVGNCAQALMSNLQAVGTVHDWHFLRSSINFTAHPWSDLWLHAYLPWKLRQLQADIYFSPAFYIPQFSGGAKIVTMVHDLAVFRFPQSFPLRFSFYFRRIINHAVNKADHIIVNSNFTKREVLKYFPFLGDEMITVIPLGPAMWTKQLLASTSANGHRPSAPSPLQGPFFLHVGTLEPRKNIVRLINTFRRWSQRHPEWKLALVGKGGWYGDQIQEMAEGNSDRIVLMGYVSDEELVSLYRCADGLIVPSIYEGFGIPVLEGILADVPLAVSRIQPFLEIAQDHLITFSPNNEEEIEDALEALSNRRGEGPRIHPLKDEILAHYSWENAAHKLLQVFEGLS